MVVSNSLSGGGTNGRNEKTWPAEESAPLVAGSGKSGAERPAGPVQLGAYCAP